MNYNRENIFAKILRKEIPAEFIYEDEYAIALNDIEPKAKVHVLVIPCGEYISFDDFTQRATKDDISGFFSAVQKVTQKLELQKKGYRLTTNHGADSGQIVHHFHMHILGGEKLKDI